MNRNIHWQQTFSRYLKTIALLERFVQKAEQLNAMEQLGMIKSFEYTYELGWNTIKDFYEDQGENNIQGSRDAIQLAFKRGLIRQGDIWMEMLKDRNRTAHTYNEKTAEEIAGNILSRYFSVFTELKRELEMMRDKQ